MAATPVVQSAYAGLPAVEGVPTNILAAGLLSPTSSAPECFINQRFANKLQAFMVSYVNSISSTYPVSAV